MQLYGLEGFLDRRTRSRHRGNFVLKGGVLLAAMQIGGRHETSISPSTRLRVNLQRFTRLRTRSSRWPLRTALISTRTQPQSKRSVNTRRVRAFEPRWSERCQQHRSDSTSTSILVTPLARAERNRTPSAPRFCTAAGSGLLGRADPGREDRHCDPTLNSQYEVARLRRHRQPRYRRGRP